MINDILICPICKNSLVKKEKNFECLKYHKFPIEDNIGILVSNPDEHFNLLEKQMHGKEDWYKNDQISSYDSGPYKTHLRKRREYVQNIIEEFLNGKKAEKILDVGCGDGSNLRWLSEFTDNLWGTDYNLLRLKRAEKIIKKLEKNTKLFVANILSLPFLENSFDIIFFNHVIEHIVEDEVALKKIFDITKKGGIMILGTPNEGALSWKFAYWLEPRIKNNTDHVNFYTENSISEIAKNVGFKIREVKHMGWGFPIWTVDARIRKYKILDNLLEKFGKRFFKKQATSLYLILEK